MDDPYFKVKDEVFKALNKTRALYLRWKELGELVEKGTADVEKEWTTTELKNALRSIEWDIEDLEDTIKKHPHKFRVDNRELTARRYFIQITRDEVRAMKESLSIYRSVDRDITAHQPLLDASPNKEAKKDSSGVGINLISTAAATMAATRHSGAKYSKLESAPDSPGHYTASFDSPTHRFIAEQYSTQNRMLANQDEQLDMISDTVGTLKTVSRQIGSELEEQAVMLDEFGNELEQTDSKIDATMKRMAKVLHITNDRSQWTAIVVLSVILAIIIILFIVL